MSERILVTGGLGFVGSAVVRYLVARGYDVTVFDNGSRGSVGNIEVGHVTVVNGDICDLATISECIAAGDFSVVVHLAAMHFIPDCNSDPQACITTNVVGTENVLAACAEHDVSKVIGISSMAVYPISEEACPETDAVGPYDIYGETKVSNEMQLGRWSRGGARVAVAIRLSNAYGPRETNPHVIPVIIQQIVDGATELDLGNTAPLRDYIHVDDVASGIEALARTSLDTGYHVFNLGSGEERSVDSILEDLTAITGTPLTVRVNPAKIRPVERMHLLPDISKMADQVGWAPAVDFRSGLEALCRWYGLEVPTS